MKTVNPMFVNLKSELTKRKDQAEFLGMDVYRTRLHCSCKKEFNRRDGILIIHGNRLAGLVIRCKTCAGRDKACLVSTNQTETKGGQL